MSTRRALLFDIGNTRVKWGVLDDDKLFRTGSIAHASLQARGIEMLTRRLPRLVDEMLASNVAGPEFAKRFARVVGIHCDGDVRFVRSERQACGIVNAYRRPRQLGVDRWVAMIGARAQFKTALCVVDAGTAITIDAIDKSGQHLGGQIIPGMRLMGDSLRSDTREIAAAKGKTRDPEPWEAMFADSTDQAVAYGAVNAVCGAVERATRALRKLGQRPKLVLTGGDASRILQQLDGALVHRPNLVLEGLAHITQSGS